MRTKKFIKDHRIEETLKMMNNNLSALEETLIREYKDPQYPTVFIVGTQRSGTTLLMQLLIRNFEFSYINNFIARYWESPYIGSIIFESLKIPKQDSEDWYASELGYTKGIFGPHEFGYFWNLFFPEFIQKVNRLDKLCINSKKLKNEIAALQSINGTAFLVKNLIINSFHIQELNEMFPNSYFVYIERDPKMVIQSTYQSRLKLYGNDKEWFGLKPPEYGAIKNLPVFEQIAAQLKYTKMYIENELNSISERFYCKIKYEDLVSNTEEVLQILENNFIQLGIKKNSNTKNKWSNEIHCCRQTYSVYWF